MRLFFCVSRAAFTLLLLGVLAFGCAHRSAELTALDRYVAEDDPHYTFSLVSSVDGEGVTAHLIDMTSQSWRSEKEVDRPLWRHWVTIAVPDVVRHETGLVLVGGGDNGGDPPKASEGLACRIALATGSVVLDLGMVPNQPLTFIGDDDEPRWEDSLIAYTWDKYLEGGDDNWPARLPMTKSVVRAMDTATSFCATEAGGGVSVSKFVVAGASKRGWTTWTTAAVDDRVVAIVPIVIDMLNVVPSFEHHWEAYGFWAPAVDDYVEMGIMDRLSSDSFLQMMDMVEPYSYRERLTMPKFIMNSAGDQFFLPDSWQFYFDDLPGTKYLRYVPNTDHGLDDSDAAECMTAFYNAILTGARLPEFSWKVRDDGAIEVKTVDVPLTVKVWQATNPTARDFRKECIGKAWKSTDLEVNAAGAYEARVSAPEEGWTAFMIEVTFESGLPVPLTFTTGVHVLPETLPFAYEPPQR